MANNYIPKVIRILRAYDEAVAVKTFYFKYPLDFIPGQFLEVSYFGMGEVPISITSSPTEDSLKISFRRVGHVTEGLFNLRENDYVGIRGPFGNGFPLEQLEDKNLVFIAGGIGIAPLRSLLIYLISKRQVKSNLSMQRRTKLNSIVLLYGARSPRDLLYREELKKWNRFVKVSLTVDKPDAKWQGHVGVVTELLNEIKLDTLNTKAIICGPEIMMRFSTAKLLKLGLNPEDIIISLERYMKCGVGKCGHCYIADKFVCRDGPVFTFEQLNRLVPGEIL